MKQEQGFVAGTLVHTDKGLVPIEQIKVGDMVLSKPEIGEVIDLDEGEDDWGAIPAFLRRGKK